ncbi:sugar ABC transporter substrate-binding protein [Streptomyces sp. NPDC057580]|uniref:sugar ABC transporter substrate-binding protein n=1 Tax=Streptomyces sp. NPDC057580 TaxID=3346173 RepID=UPI0036786E6B
MSRIRHALKLTVPMVAGAVIVAGCGGPATPATNAGHDSKAVACTKAAESRLTDAAKPITMDAPSESLPTASLAGKKVWFIAASMKFPLVVELAKGFEDAAAAAGFKGTIFDGKANVAAYNEGVEQAVAHGADAIILDGQNPDVMSSSLAKAAAANIPVVSFAAYETPSVKPPAAPIRVYAGLDLLTVGRTQGDLALAKSGCSGNVLILTSDISKTLQGMAKSAKATIMKECPGCRVTLSTINSQTVSVSAPQAVRVAVQKDPALKTIISPDIYLTAAVPALRQLGAVASKLQVIGYQGDPPNLEFVRSGDVQDADVSYPPLDYVSWKLVDLVARELAAKGSPQPVLIPAQLITKETFNQSADPFAQFGDFKAAFRTRWGK